MPPKTNILHRRITDPANAAAREAAAKLIVTRHQKQQVDPAYEQDTTTTNKILQKRDRLPTNYNINENQYFADIKSREAEQPMKKHAADRDTSMLDFMNRVQLQQLQQQEQEEKQLKVESDEQANKLPPPTSEPIQKVATIIIAAPRRLYQQLMDKREFIKALYQDSVSHNSTLEEFDIAFFKDTDTVSRTTLFVGSTDTQSETPLFKGSFYDIVNAMVEYFAKAAELDALVSLFAKPYYQYILEQRKKLKLAPSVNLTLDATNKELLKALDITETTFTLEEINNIAASFVWIEAIFRFGARWLQWIALKKTEQGSYRVSDIRTFAQHVPFLQSKATFTNNTFRKFLRIDTTTALSTSQEYRSPSRNMSNPMYLISEKDQNTLKQLLRDPDNTTLSFGNMMDLITIVSASLNLQVTNFKFSKFWNMFYTVIEQRSEDLTDDSSTIVTTFEANGAFGNIETLSHGFMIESTINKIISDVKVLVDEICTDDAYFESKANVLNADMNIFTDSFNTLDRESQIKAVQYFNNNVDWKEIQTKLPSQVSTGGTYRRTIFNLINLFCLQFLK